MSNLRRLSRSAHPERWEQLKAFRRLRRASQQALRAKERGDEATMNRLQAILARLAPQLFTDGDAGLQEALADDDAIVQKAVDDTVLTSEDNEKELDKPADRP